MVLEVVVLLVGCGNIGCIIVVQVELVVVVLLDGCGIGVNGGFICYGVCSSGCGIAVGSCGSNADNGGVVMVLVSRGNGGYGSSYFGSGGGHYGVANGSCGSIVCCSCGRDGDCGEKGGSGGVSSNGDGGNSGLW